MCVKDLSDIKVFEKDTIVYKVVVDLGRRVETYRSQFDASGRNLQIGFSSAGKSLEYRIGEIVTSSLKFTPGIYTYYSKDSARRATRYYEYCVIRILCKAGTRYREGRLPYCIGAPRYRLCANVNQRSNTARCFLIEEGLCLNVVGRYIRST